MSNGWSCSRPYVPIPSVRSGPQPAREPSGIAPSPSDPIDGEARSSGATDRSEANGGHAESGSSRLSGERAAPPRSGPHALVARRGFGLGEGGPTAADLGDDLFGGPVPDERLRVVVPVLGPLLDGVDEVGDAAEHASSESTFGQFFEPSFDEVQPRRARWREVQMPARSFGMVEEQ
jgi:hypothetical protein